MNYIDFLKNKVVIAEKYGFEPRPPMGELLPHAKAITQWALKGGRRAIFASFGLTKTAMQLELAYQVIEETGKPFLICMPLNVMREFKKDNSEFFQSKYETEYITDSDEVTTYEKKVYMTNYERVRKGDIDALKFGGVSFDEASILRNLKTETTNYVLSHFKQVPFRFVATATPSPNEFTEIINYAAYLGVADRGHILTRFFKRNPKKAGDLTLMENKKKEFWQWVSTWAVFINTPSDLGFPDEGYDLPELNIVEHRLENLSDDVIINKRGEIVLLKESTGDLQMASREKQETVQMRVEKAFEIVQQEENKYSNFILWHHLETERKAIEKQFKEYMVSDLRSVFGAQKNSQKEQLLGDFSEGKYQILSTKPSIAGSGSNFQHVCHKMIFVGIDDKFNDFIQAVHRTFRFRQKFQVDLHIIYTNNEDKRFENLMRKWEQHKELQKEMIALVREFGLNDELIKSQMERQVFENGDKVHIGDATLYNNDNVIATDDIANDSVHLIHTSIPFGDHYEYTGYFNDFGHNHGNEAFFKQMDFLIPKLHRVLQPGRIAAIHVKDRIRYSYQNGTSFTTIDPFSDETVAAFRKHGFYLMGRVTITTDVVAENNQTYRLGHSEQCKDGSKMGVGLPEYLLIFRKAPSSSNNAYADVPVASSKEEYPVGEWQLDAHAYWKSSGNRQVPVEELAQLNLKRVSALWKQYQKEGLYDFEYHRNLSEKLNQKGKLSRKYMTLPPLSNNELVWTDINRMKTLNAKQVSKKKEKHICPLQLDIIERTINRFTMPGETVYDPFGGLMSVPYQSLKMGRKAIAAELNTDYYKDGLFYVKAINEEINLPTLFDVVGFE